jgi:hypothetical protein
MFPRGSQQSLVLILHVDHFELLAKPSKLLKQLNGCAKYKEKLGLSLPLKHDHHHQCLKSHLPHLDP